MFPYDNNYQPNYGYGIFPQQIPAAQQNILPPQNVLQANGKPSIDNLRMSPNSSVFIKDSTNPAILWYCTSDSLGNVTKTMYDIHPHEEAQLFSVENLVTIVAQLSDRLKKLEEQNAVKSDTDSSAN